MNIERGLSVSERRFVLLALNTQLSEAKNATHDDRQSDFERTLNREVVATIESAIDKIKAGAN